MWRELTRKNQALSDEEMRELLRGCKRGFIALNGDDSYPYVSPINYYFDEQDGCLYFHGGTHGYRVDAMRANARASFSLIDEGKKEEEDKWWYIFKSVVIFGRIEFIEDAQEKDRIARALSEKFTDDEAYIQSEIDRFMKTTLVYRLVPEYMTGKRVREN